MKKIHFYGLLLLVYVGLFNLMCTNKDQGRITILYETDYFADSLKTVIAEVVKKYDSAYMLPYDTLKIRDTVIYSSENNGLPSITQARTFGTTIKVNKLTALNPLKFVPLEKKYVRDLIAHELFHSLKPKERRLLTKPIETGWTGSHSKFMICHGLNLGYHLRDEGGGFPLFEEASAELFAQNLYSDFEPSSDYFPIGKLLAVILDNTNLDFEDIIVATKTNNFELIVSWVYDKPINHLRRDDYIFLTHTFVHYMRHPEKDPSIFPSELKTFLASY